MFTPLFWILAIAVVTAFGGGIAARDVILKKHLLPKIRFTRAGYGFLACSVALVVLPVVLYYVQSASDKKEWDQRADALQKQYQVGNDRTLKIIGQTLAGYGLELDTTAKRVISMIHDSANVRTVDAEQPVLMVEDTPLYGSGINYLNTTHGMNNYRITVVSEAGSSSFYHIKMLALIVDSNDITSTVYKVRYYGHINCPLTVHDKIPKDAASSWTFDISNAIPYDRLCVWVSGSYYDLAGKTIHHIDEIYYNLKSTNLFGGLVGETKTKMKAFFLKGQKATKM